MFKRIARLIGKVKPPEPDKQREDSSSPTFSAAPNSSSPVSRLSDESNLSGEEKTQKLINDLQLDLNIQMSAGKGWPTYASVIVYHQHMGLIIVGTEIGSIYVYGDGFQYLRTSTGIIFTYYSSCPHADH